MNGALFPGHLIIPEEIYNTKQWEAQQVENHLGRIRKAAGKVFEFQWHDNDAEAFAALEALRSAINGKGEQP